MLRFEEIKEKDKWNRALNDFNGLFTQSFEYGTWQEKQGRVINRFFIFSGQELVGLFSVIFFKVFGQYTYGYTPFGPVLKNNDVLFQKDFVDFLKQLGKKQNAIFVRIESIEKLKDFKLAPKSSYKGSHFQLRNDWVLVLEKPIEILVKEFDQNARYSIHKAEKNKVLGFIKSGDDVESQKNIMALLQETGKRNNFSLHDSKYYEAIFETLDESNSFFVFAKKDDVLIAGGLFFIVGSEVMYLLGGSSTDDRKFFGSYIVQFEAIKESQRRQKKIYNFGAVCDSFGNPKSLKGVTLFKKKFGGNLRAYGDFFDLVLKPALYFLYIIRKKI